MSHEVYAGGWEIAAKAGMNKSIARFPDVCLSPPSPPAGPIPIPYPNTSFSSDLKKGSKTVELGGKPAALAQQSFYKPSALGNEAATRSFGANVITHQITGKTYFQAWSMDVKFEGKNVCRHFDITTSNHASTGTTTGPNLSTEAAAITLLKEGKCPCCEGPIHENQKDENGPYDKIEPGDYYQNLADTMQAKFDSIADDVAAGVKDYTKTPEGIADVTEKTQKQLDTAKQDVETVKNAGAIDPPCDNVHPSDEKCGLHLNVTRTMRQIAPEELKDAPHSKIKAHVRKDLGFTNSVKKQSRKEWQDKGHEISKGSPVNHKTPLSAGGCPTSQKNLVPSDALSEECLKVEEAQTRLQDLSNKL